MTTTCLIGVVVAADGCANANSLFSSTGIEANNSVVAESVRLMGNLLFGNWHQVYRIQRALAAKRRPKTKITAPATRATMPPAGPIFSSSTNTVSAATQSRFITPTAKRIHIKAQQQPRQYAP